jgi:DNA replication protein
MDKIIDAIDWRMILVDNYKKVGLNENELSIILVTNSLIQKGVDFITPDIVALKMTLDFQEIDTCFTNLIKKDILTIDGTNKKIQVSIEPLKKRLIEIFYEELKKETDVPSSKDRNDIFVLFETELGRALSQFEVNTINDWFEQGNSIATIKEALNVATLAKVKTIRYIDKVLLEWKRREEISKNGVSPLSEKWRKNLEETMEIAKINWMEE